MMHWQLESRAHTRHTYFKSHSRKGIFVALKRNSLSLCHKPIPSVEQFGPIRLLLLISLPFFCSDQVCNISGDTSFINKQAVWFSMWSRRGGCFSQPARLTDIQTYVCVVVRRLRHTGTRSRASPFFIPTVEPKSPAGRGGGGGGAARCPRITRDEEGHGGSRFRD